MGGVYSVHVCVHMCAMGVLCVSVLGVSVCVCECEKLVMGSPYNNSVH